MLRISIAPGGGLAYLKFITRGFTAGRHAARAAPDIYLCAAAGRELRERRRKDVSFVYSRSTLRSPRRRRHSGRRRAPHGPGRRLGLVVAGTSVPALIIAYTV